MNIYKCIKNIKIFDRIILREGELIDIDNPPTYNIPFLHIDFNDTEYFSKYVTTYNLGQWVQLKPKSLYGYVTAFNPKTMLYTIHIEAYNRTKEVHEIDMYPVDLYYFINTKGQIHGAFTGKDKERDAFTKQTNNQFNTKEEAKKALKKIWGN